MGRGRNGVGRWAVAAPAGLVVNLLLIGLLSLVERATPLVEPPAMRVELDRAEEELRPAPRRRAQPASAPEPARPAGPPSANEPDGAASEASGEGDGAQASPGGQSGPAIDPSWRVDPRAVERWRLTEGNPDFRWGRYHRACKGLSNEHLTDEEKDRCWGGFAAKASPTEMGPPDRRAAAPPKFKPRGLPPPPPPFAKDARRQARCSAYRAGRASQPRLRDGLC